MKKLIKPSVIRGEMKAPASKSYAQRAIAASMLAKGVSVLRNYSSCNDSDAAIDIVRKLGAEVIVLDGELTIVGRKNQIENIINCGESGLGARMFTPIASIFDEKIRINGGGTLALRTMEMLEKPLIDLGAQYITNSGYLPVSVQGPLLGGKTTIDGSLSSQVLTGLLMATPLAKNDTEIFVNNLKSIPYIEMTIELLQQFEIKVVNNSFESFFIKSNQHYQPQVYSIEGDWSGAAFHLVAGAIGGMVVVSNLNQNSKQADKFVLGALDQVGAKILWEHNRLIVAKEELKAFSFDATNCPDLFPPLVVLAANCDGVSEIKGVNRLKHKESDRATVLKNEFSKIGIHIDIVNDIMIVHGSEINGGVIDSHNDHRIAMAAAIAATSAENDIIVDGAECISKSYPMFYEDFQKIGGFVEY